MVVSQVPARVIGLPQTAAAAADVLYSVDSASDGLSIIDLATNTSTFIGRLDPDITKLTTPIAMSVRPSDKKLFVWNNSDGNTNATFVSTGVLLTVDACTGLATKVDAATAPLLVSHANACGMLDNPRNLADDQIKAIAHQGGLVGILALPERVGKGEVAIEDLLGGSIRVAGAEFDPSTGVLYGLELNGNRLVTINTTTGAATVVGSLSTAVGITGSIVFAPDGHLIGSSIGGTVFDLDKTTAAVSNLRAIAGSPAMQGLGFAPPCATADLSAALTAAPTTVPAGATVTLTASAKNLGPDATTGTLIDLSIPIALTLSGMSTSCVTPSGPPALLFLDFVPTTYLVECTVGGLANGATATASIQVRPSRSGTFTITEFVSSALRDPNSANDTASVDVVATPDLTGIASCGGVALALATVDLLSGSTIVASALAGDDGSYAFDLVAPNTTFGIRYTSADGSVTCLTGVATNASGVGAAATAPVPTLNNNTWEHAYPLFPDATPQQDYMTTPRDAWFKFPIAPSDQVIVSLRDCQFDCSLILFTDIAQAAASMQSGSIAAVQVTSAEKPKTGRPIREDVRRAPGCMGHRAQCLGDL